MEKEKEIDISLIGTIIKTVNVIMLFIFGKQRSKGKYPAKFSMFIIVFCVLCIVGGVIAVSTKWVVNDFADASTVNLHFYDLNLFHNLFESRQSYGKRNALSIFLSNGIMILYFAALIVSPMLVEKKGKKVYWVIFAAVTLCSILWNSKVMSMNQEKKFSSINKTNHKKNTIKYVDIDTLKHATVLTIEEEIKEIKDKISKQELFLISKNKTKELAHQRLYIRTKQRQEDFEKAKREVVLEELTIQNLNEKIDNLNVKRKKTIHNLNILNNKKRKEYQSGLNRASILGRFEGTGLDLLFIGLAFLLSLLWKELDVKDNSNLEITASNTVDLIGSGIKKISIKSDRLNGIKSGLNEKLNTGLNKIKTKIKQKDKKIKIEKVDTINKNTNLFNQTSLNYSEEQKEELINKLKTNRKYKDWHDTFIELSCSKNETGRDSTAWVDGNFYKSSEIFTLASEDLGVSMNTIKSHYRNNYTELVLKRFDPMELHLLYKEAVSKRKGGL